MQSEETPTPLYNVGDKIEHSVFHNNKKMRVRSIISIVIVKESDVLYLLDEILWINESEIIKIVQRAESYTRRKLTL